MQSGSLSNQWVILNDGYVLDTPIPFYRAGASIQNRFLKCGASGYQSGHSMCFVLLP